MRQNGTIRNYCDRGFGFLTSESGEHIFFHVSEVTDCEDEANLTPGRLVTFQLTNDGRDGRLRAIGVELL